MDTLLYQLLAKNTIRVDEQELSYQFKSHPSYPSLHAITGVLNHFSIDNLALEVPVDLDTYTQLPIYFMAQIEGDKGKEMVLVEKKETKCVLMDASNKSITYTVSEFLATFTGIVVAVEKTEGYVPEKLSKQKNTFMYFLLLIGVLVLTPFVMQYDWLAISTVLLSIFGIAVSFAIVKQENGETTGLGAALCSTQKASCDSVIQSKGATLFDAVKLSDASMVYFGFSILFALGSLLFPSMYTLSYGLFLIALPITAYSIYYQKVVAKQWCRLCLVIVSVLWMQGFLSIYFFYQYGFVASDLVLSSSIFVFAGSILLSAFAWDLIKNTLIQTKKLKESEQAFFRFKRNFELFDSILKQSPRVETYLPQMDEMVFGNPNSALEITIVTSPFCGHCTPVHEQMHKVLAKYGDSLHYRVRMSVDIGEPENPLYGIASSLVTIYQDEGPGKAMEALDAIYNGQAVEEWFASYKKETNQNTLLFKQQQWCDHHDFNFTPVILINGQAYPKLFQREDLIYFVDELIEKEEVAFSSLSI